MSSEKRTSIEMINTSNIYPIIRGEISETDAQAQPCDTQTISSYHDIDETNSDNEMLKAQPLKVVCLFSNVFVSRTRFNDYASKRFYINRSEWNNNQNWCFSLEFLSAKRWRRS